MASKDRPNGYWSIARIKKEASKYPSRSDFNRNASAAYSAAADKGILQAVCAHMPKRKRTPRVWPQSRVERAATKFSTRKAFQLGSPGGYRAALRLGIVDAVSKHMVRQRVPKGYWNESSVRAVAVKYKTRAAFRRHSPTACAAAHKYGVMDRVCSHMKVIKRPDWTPDQIHEEAKKYTSRSEFEKRNQGAYKAAHRRGLLDAVCGHMRRIGHRFKRAIYVYEFSDKSVYVGLTYDYERRHRQHMLLSKPIIDKTKRFGCRLIRKDSWMLPEAAAREEARLLQSYSRRGWQLINVSMPGGIGGSLRKWTPEALSLEVRKYRTLSDFQRYSRGAYHAACKSGILASISGELKRLKQPNGTWSRASVLREALKYDTRSQFVANAPGARNAASRFGILNKACRHMRQFKLPNGAWTRAKILNSARACANRTEFQKKFPGAYDAAIRLRLQSKIQRMLPRRLPEPFWTDERLISEARKYSTRMDFKTRAPSAYVIAGRKGMRDKVCRHMIPARSGA
jgi:predicted GIY-YIG superfamily endonuclease